MFVSVQYVKLYVYIDVVAFINFCFLEQYGLYCIML
jgi:hypothetical protein